MHQTECYLLAYKNTNFNCATGFTYDEHHQRSDNKEPHDKLYKNFRKDFAKNSRKCFHETFIVVAKKISKDPYQSISLPRWISIKFS